MYIGAPRVVDRKCGRGCRPLARMELSRNATRGGSAQKAPPPGECVSFLDDTSLSPRDGPGCQTLTCPCCQCTCTHPRTTAAPFSSICFAPVRGGWVQRSNAPHLAQTLIVRGHSCSAQSEQVSLGTSGRSLQVTRYRDDGDRPSDWHSCLA